MDAVRSALSRLGLPKTLMVLAVLAVLLTLVYVYAIPERSEAITVNTGDIEREYRAVGLVDANTKAVIAATTNDQIANVFVQEGDRVQPGQTLVELVNIDIESRMEADRADAVGMAFAVTEARANLESTRVRLREVKLRHNRFKDLFRKGFLSKADWIAVEAEVDVAENEVASAVAQVARLRQNRSSQGLRVEAGRQVLEQTRIKAPFGGLVTRQLRQRGEIATAGSTILEVVDPASLNVVLRFNAAMLSQIKIGDRINIDFSYGQKSVPATIERISRLVNEDTDEVEVVARFLRQPDRWALGQRVMGLLPIIAAQSVLVLPQDYVVRTAGEAGVWIMHDGRARWQTVELGRLGDRSVEITSGLSSGDKVLRPEGQYSYRPVRILSNR